MNLKLQRSELLIGSEGIKKLMNSSVAVFGVGGVGGYAVEALARSGVGRIDLIDSDTVSESNINRQIIATVSTIGKYKVDAAKERILDINPDIDVRIYKEFYSEETVNKFDLSKYTYVIDAIDSVKSKLLLIKKAKECNTPIISSMGAGNKLDPTAFEVSDISKTSVCPLAKVIRTELRRMGINHLKVVYSKEEPIKAIANDEKMRHAPGSIAFVPSVVGLIIAGEVIKDIALKTQ